MTVDANRVWSATLTLTGSGDATGAQRFKFDVFGNWTENYGDNEGDGIADKTVMIDRGSGIDDARRAEHRTNVNDATCHDDTAGTQESTRTDPGPGVHDLCKPGPGRDQRGVPLGAHGTAPDANDDAIGSRRHLQKPEPVPNDRPVACGLQDWPTIVIENHPVPARFHR